MKKMFSIDLQQKYWQYATLLILSVIWGTSFILMKRGLETYLPVELAALRVSIGFIIFTPFILKNFKLIRRKLIRSFLIAGFLGIGIPAILFSIAQTNINSAMAGILNSLTPLFTMLLGIILYKTEFRLMSFLGILMGFAGAVSLIFQFHGFTLGDINVFALLIVLATGLYGINVNEIKYKLKDLSGIEITSLAFLFIGPFGLAYIAFSDFSFHTSNPLWIRSLLAVTTLSVFGSVIAVVIFNYLLKFTSAVFASSVTYIMPVFAIFWGINDGEKVGFTELISVAVILFGVYLVNKNGKTN